MTTTAFRIDLILEAIGMKRLISHNATPTTTNTTTMFINGIFSLLSYREAIRGPGAGVASKSGLQPLDLLTENPASLNQAEHQYDQRDDQQDVNQPAGGERGEHSQSPQDQQDYEQCPKHLFVPSQ